MVVGGTQCRSEAPSQGTALSGVCPAYRMIYLSGILGCSNFRSLVAVQERACSGCLLLADLASCLHMNSTVFDNQVLWRKIHELTSASLPDPAGTHTLTHIHTSLTHSLTLPLTQLYILPHNHTFIYTLLTHTYTCAALRTHSTDTGSL